eukprot:3610288-Prymnesium_polylepis.1
MRRILCVLEGFRGLAPPIHASLAPSQLAPDVSALSVPRDGRRGGPRPIQRPRSGHRPPPTLLRGTCFAPALE